jgi:hypothetical protein
MTGFDEREKGFEAKFRQDQELAFKIRARANKLLGLWAASQLGLTGDEAEAYAREVVDADLLHPGDDDVIDKVVADLSAKGIAVDAARVRVELNRCVTEARKQLGLD